MRFLELNLEKYTWLQSWELAHLLIAHSLIRSFRSNKMSNCERFAQIAQDKWATVSESLRLLKTNERPWAFRTGRSEEMRNLLKNFKSCFTMFYLRLKKKNSKKCVKRSFSLISSFLVSDVSESLILLTKNEQMSESHIFLSKSLICSFLNKKRAICSDIKWANSQPSLRTTACLNNFNM